MTLLEFLKDILAAIGLVTVLIGLAVGYAAWIYPHAINFEDEPLGDASLLNRGRE